MHTSLDVKNTLNELQPLQQVMDTSVEGVDATMNSFFKIFEWVLFLYTGDQLPLQVMLTLLQA